MPDFAADIKNAVTMRQVCDMYGIAVNRGGFACCPFHSEKTASMKIYDGNRGYHCFGCGVGGSTLDFVMDYFHLDLIGAERKLNTDFRLGLPLDGKMSREERRKADRIAEQRRREQEARQKAREAVYNRYHAALDRWAGYDKAIIQNAPQGVTEPYSDEYAEAVRNIAAAAYELDEAEIALWETEHREV